MTDIFETSKTEQFLEKLINIYKKSRIIIFLSKLDKKVENIYQKIVKFIYSFYEKSFIYYLLNKEDKEEIDLFETSKIVNYILNKINYYVNLILTAYKTSRTKRLLDKIF